jgi:hypothetical protein
MRQVRDAQLIPVDIYSSGRQQLVITGKPAIYAVLACRDQRHV